MDRGDCIELSSYKIIVARKIVTAFLENNMEIIHNILENKRLQCALSELEAFSKDDPIEDDEVGKVAEMKNNSTSSTRFKNHGNKFVGMKTVLQCKSEYLRLRNWVMSSLDDAKNSMITLCYPIFEYIYIAMIRLNARNEANLFMINWGEDYRSNQFTKGEIVKLASSLSYDVMKSEYFLHESRFRKRHERIRIRVNARAYGLFMRFLDNHNMFLTMAVINDEVLYLLDDSRSNVQNVPTNSFTSKHRLFDQCSNSGNNEVVYDGVLGMRTINYYTVLQKDSVGGSINSSRKFYSELLEKSSKRRQIVENSSKILHSPSSVIWPTDLGCESSPTSSKPLQGGVNFSLLYATMTNSFDNLSCMDVGGLSGSEIICGFQDGCIRVWPEKIESSYFRGESPSCSKNNFISPRFKGNEDITKGDNGPPRSDRNPQIYQSVSETRGINWQSPETKYFELRGHKRAIYSICQDASGRHVLSTSSDNTVRLWNMESARCIAKYKSFSPSWYADLSPRGHYFAVCNQNCSACLYNFEYDTPLRIFVGHNSDVNSCKFHSDELYILTGSEDRSARLWDIRSGSSSQIYVGATASINVVAISKDGIFFAAGCRNGDIVLFDMLAGKRIAIFDGHDGCVNSLSFSPDGCRLCSGGDDNSIRIWNVHKLSTEEDDVNIANNSFTFHTKFSRVCSINYIDDYLIYGCGIFPPSELRHVNKRFAHNLRCVDVVDDFDPEIV